jgi:hypothetical protein
LNSNTGPVGTFVSANSMVFASLAAASYVLIWALLRWKSAGTSEEEKSMNLYTFRDYVNSSKSAKWGNREVLNKIPNTICHDNCNK